MKFCNKCGQDRPLTEFYWRPDRMIYDAPCKPCIIKRNMSYARATPHKRAAAHKKRLERRPDHIKEHKLKWRYGLSKGQYDQLFASQGFKCAICGAKENVLKNGKKMRFYVDHCHKSGKVRGLLCLRCNSGIGYLGDNPQKVRAAAQYLEAHLVFDGSPEGSTKIFVASEVNINDGEGWLFAERPGF